MKDGYVSFTTSSGPVCTHRNGWFQTIRFWIFERRFFICTDCGEVQPISKWRLR